MFGGFLQRETLNMRQRGASFYVLNSISTWSLKDLNISMNLIYPRLFIFPHLILQLYGLHKDEKNSHGYAYVNPLLIWGLSLPFVCKN
jgi:hypothetical protein